MLSLTYRVIASTTERAAASPPAPLPTPSATMADRAGEIYGGEVIPDDLVAGTMTGDTATDAALRTAMHWLLTQTC